MSENNKVYGYDEAFLASVKYFGGDELAAKVFVDKYSLKDREGRILEDTPEKMHRRLAKEFARIEKKYPNPIKEEEIFDLIDHFKYIIPQGSPMSAIGNPYHIQSSGNCFSIKPPYDSYGGIFYTDQQLGQLMKRRCVHENSTVFVLEKGNILIKDIEVGDSVLSYNVKKKEDEFRVVKNKFYSNVDINDRVIIYLSNGTIVRTSKRHPILSIREKGYIYIYASNLKEKDILIKPQFKKYLNNITKQMGKKAWFVGCHMGDGTLGIHNTKNKKSYGEYSYKKLRIRNTGDNENIIKEYSKIVNDITGSNAHYRPCNNKYYKTQCWEYTNVCNNVSILSKKYLDDQIGKKTYCGKIPSYIKKYKLWIPFLAGLIDSDGYVRPYGSIDISICAKNIIDELGCFLSSIGISYKITKRESKYSKNSVCSVNSVFHPIYKLMIHANYDFNQLLIKWMKHENKIKVLKNANYRSFSHKKFLLEEERNFILDKYNLIKYKNDKKNIKDRNNLSAIIRLLKKDKNVGIGSLKSFLNNNIISKHKFDEINQRVYIKEIKKDKEEGKYIDIEVDGNNNFYAGNFGMVNIHNCGVGLSLNNLRPKGEMVQNAAKTTDGIAVFMERYSNTCREVAQNGRRGALILLLNIHHPEIKTFITIKQDKSKVTGANVSIQATDDFMKAVKRGDEFELKWPVDSKEPLISQKISAKEVWDLFIDSSWSSAEPGILFMDTVINNSVSNCYGKIDEAFYDTSCNPCGEIVMGTDSCRLLALNLYSFVENKFTPKSYFNFNKFNIYVQKSQRLMDDMVDLEIELIKKILIKIKSDPEPEYIKKIEKETWELLLDICKKGRRTGLGVTGLADTLASLNIRYGSNKSIIKTEEIYKALAINAYKSTCTLARERGAFPVFSSEIEKDNNFINKVIKEDKELEKIYKKHGRRNIALTTTPPAGCLEENIKIKTDRGIISLKDLFEVNNIDINDLREKYNLWFDCDEEIYVYDINENKHKINKLYWKGYTDGYSFNFSSGENIKTSKEHKFLVLIDEDTAEWKKSEDLKINDKIVKIIEG